MITLSPRIDFGGGPWPFPVSTFDLAWLKSIFVPVQRQRLNKVTAAIADATRLIEVERKHASDGPEHAMVDTLGQRLANGNIIRTAAEQRLQQELQTHSARQIVYRIIKIRQSLDKTVPPILKEMQRASLTAKTLQERVFDKFNCLWRTSAGMGLEAAASLRADYAKILERSEPMELARIAQRAIDGGGAQALVLVDCLLRENFHRPRADRNFANQDLLNEVTIPEYDEAQPLLEETVDLNNRALLLWADFSGQANRATTLRIGAGLGKLALAPTSAAPQRAE